MPSLLLGAGSQVDARGAGGARLLKGVLHKSPTNTASSSLRGHDEVLQVCLCARQCPEDAERDHPDNPAVLLCDERWRILAYDESVFATGASVGLGRACGRGLPMGGSWYSHLRPRLDHRASDHATGPALPCSSDGRAIRNPGRLPRPGLLSILPMIRLRRSTVCRPGPQQSPFLS
jgi:hypothetical protein